MTLGRRAKVLPSKPLLVSKASKPLLPSKIPQVLKNLKAIVDKAVSDHEAAKAAATADIEIESAIEHQDEDHDFGDYAIQWNKEKTHFTSKQVSGGEAYKFYGWYRKTLSGNNQAYCIDIYAKHHERDYPVDSIAYLDKDPRGKLSSLNADICAAINKWFYTKLDGTFKTIDIIRKQAEQPTIHIDKIGSIDAIILKLKECRDTAIRCGGHRLVQLIGDKENDIPLNITINVTQQAIALEGKVPSLELGSISDTVIAMSAGARPLNMPSKSMRTFNTPEPGNVQALVERLRVADAAEQRKIRAVLRKMGHRGGARSFKKPGTK